MNIIKLHTLDDNTYMDIIKVLELLAVFDVTSPYDVDLLSLLLKRKNINISANNEDAIIGLSFKLRMKAVPKFMYATIAENQSGDEVIRSVTRLSILEDSFNELGVSNKLGDLATFLENLYSYMTFSGLYNVRQLLSLFLVGRPVRSKWEDILLDTDKPFIRDTRKQVLTVLRPRNYILYVMAKKGSLHSESSYLSSRGELAIATCIDVLLGTRYKRALSGKQLYSFSTKTDDLMRKPKGLKGKKILVSNMKHLKKLDRHIMEYYQDRDMPVASSYTRGLSAPLIVKISTKKTEFTKDDTGTLVEPSEVINVVTELRLQRLWKRFCITDNRTAMYDILKEKGFTDVESIKAFIRVIELYDKRNVDKMPTDDVYYRINKPIGAEGCISFFNIVCKPDTDTTVVVLDKWIELARDLVLATFKSTNFNYSDFNNPLEETLKILSALLDYDVPHALHIIDGKLV